VQAVLSIIGLILGGLAMIMLVPAIVDPTDATPFLWGAVMTAFASGALYFSNRGGDLDISVRQAFLLTTGAWLLVSAFASLPFMVFGLSPTDAVFETVSGLTTTGSTVLGGLDQRTPAMLLWRALLQWIGGIGIVVTSIAILPFLRVGGMQLFRTESSDKSEKELPRAASVAAATLWVYAGLTVAAMSAYWLAGMSGFDAVTHAMTTVSTGGFSTHDASLGYFKSPLIQWVAALFMLLAGLPFVMYIRIFRKRVIASVQARALIIFLSVVISVLTLWRVLTSDVSWFKGLTEVAFNVISVVTTTGYATADYTTWGSFAVTAFFMLILVGACTGSTTGGLKMMRFLVAFKMIRMQIRKSIQPHGVFVEKYEGKPLSEDVTSSVGMFFYIFIGSVVLLALLLQLYGLDFETSLSGAATAIANVGPGIGPVIGPAGNFAPLPDAAKWLLSAGMLLGRLEFMTVLVLLTPAYWRT